MIAQGADGTEAMTTIVAPSDPGGVQGAVALPHPRGPRGGGPRPTPAPSSPRSWRPNWDFGVGDAIVFAEQDDLGNATATTYSVPVAGIIENYIGDYAFMTPETYERTFGEEADNLTVYARATTDEGERSSPLRGPARHRRGGYRGLQRRGHRLLQADAALGEHGRGGARGGRGGTGVHRAVQPDEHQHHRAGPRDRHLEGARLHAPRGERLHLPRDRASGHAWERSWAWPSASC